jgi:hypothetical protein
MTFMIRRLSAVLSIALLFGPLALAQNSTPQMLKQNTTPTVIPIWNLHSGQIEALLVLENDPPVHGRAWVRAPQQIGDSASVLGAAPNFGNGMAIFCSGQAGGFNQLSVLGDCQFGKSSTRYPAINSPGLETKSMLKRNPDKSSLGFSESNQGQRRMLPTEFDNPHNSAVKSQTPSTAQATEGWVSINGNLTKARLIPASQFPKGVPTEWDRETFKIPKRESSLSGEVVGNVVQIPGQDSNLKSVGAGLSWKTPWKSKVSVGAESLLSQGRSSLDLSNQSPIVDQRVDGVQPYVRVEIDL